MDKAPLTMAMAAMANPKFVASDVAKRLGMTTTMLTVMRRLKKKGLSYYSNKLSNLLNKQRFFVHQFLYCNKAW